MAGRTSSVPRAPTSTWPGCTQQRDAFSTRHDSVLCSPSAIWSGCREPPISTCRTETVSCCVFVWPPPVAVSVYVVVVSGSTGSLPAGSTVRPPPGQESSQLSASVVAHVRTTPAGGITCTAEARKLVTARPGTAFWTVSGGASRTPSVYLQTSIRPEPSDSPTRTRARKKARLSPGDSRASPSVGTAV